MIEEILLPGVVLVNVGEEKDLEKPLEELSLLAKTAGLEVRAILTQHKERPDKAYYIGTGKLLELKSVAEATESELIIFDNELSGTQLNNLEKELGLQVWDRATLIIEIFARHATSNEGKLQVELMRKRKMLPRVLGQGLVLSRQGGGGGGGQGARRGGGEQQQELDKRTIRGEIRDLEQRIEKLTQERALRREKHLKNKVKTVSLVGYTNAGKSTIMNALTKAGVLEENKLFATLDPISRKMWLDIGKEFLLVDTVGFISRLPHEFVRAFRSTLEETKYSDLILHVVDGSNPDCTMQFDVVNEVLESIGVKDTPILVVINKMDKERDDTIPLPTSENVVMISAKTGMGIQLLKDKISTMLFGGQMDLYDVVKSRHSVRKYLDKEIPSNIVKTLHEEISKCNEEGNLHIQLVLNDYNAFSGMKASYGKIKGVSNYIVLVGKRSKFLDEKLGYYGEKLVLKAQELGLNSCWIGLSMIYNNTKDAYEIRDGERKRLIIAIGYGENCGHDRNSKKFSDVVLTKLPEYPNWFIKGIEFSLLAPTAMNQQKFSFELDNNQVTLRHGNGFYTKVDKGIVKYHFELGAGKNNFVWKK